LNHGNGARTQVSTENLYEHVKWLSVKIGERHMWKGSSLDETADYIESVFQKSGYAVRRQTYSCYGQEVSNIIAETSGSEKGFVIVGAHYDTVPGTHGADDNASAVAGMLEIARLFQYSPKREHLVFVAFVNEEPPCFGSQNMGSMVYAKNLRGQRAPVKIMIALEMIGYFSSKIRQRYPLPGMSLFYPKRGDFIGVVGNFRSSKYVSFLKKGIRKHSAITVKSLIAPENFGGISLSDNSSFWRYGYRAVMVTDTSFYRNIHYHQPSDTIDTLNFEAMGQVVQGLYSTLSEI
jgi:Zn-dependent M28 family amino/carboxypeptidase